MKNHVKKFDEFVNEEENQNTDIIKWVDSLNKNFHNENVMKQFIAGFVKHPILIDFFKSAIKKGYQDYYEADDAHYFSTFNKEIDGVYISIETSDSYAKEGYIELLVSIDNNSTDPGFSSQVANIKDINDFWKYLEKTIKEAIKDKK